MSELCDDDGQLIFTEDFTHHTKLFKDTLFEDEVLFDLIETNGNLWLSGSDTMKLMGFPEHHKGGFGRTLRRISHPDIIKIKDTPFRFTDGRRNRGSFISPRAVLQFHEGKTQGFNPIKAVGFVEWMNEHLLTGGLDADAWSPALKKPPPLEPVFRSVTKVVDQDEQGRPLDPMRTTRKYRYIPASDPIGSDEVEFCMCEDARNGLGKCWCGGIGQVRTKPFVPYDGDEVLDDGDDFSGSFVAPSRLAVTDQNKEAEALLMAATDF